MPINCKQPNVYQYGESWTTGANEYYTLCAACRTTSLNTKYQATYIANSDGNRQTRTAEITRHSSSPPRRGGGGGGGGGQLPVHFCLLQLWSTRYYIGLQRIEFEIVFVTFCKTYKSFLLPQISPNQVESAHTLSHNHCSKVGM